MTVRTLLTCRLLSHGASTCFECDVPEDETDPRRFGYSRDKRSDCVPVIVVLVGTPRGRLTKLETELAERPWQEVCP